MAVSVQIEKGNQPVVRVSGVLGKEEHVQAISEAAKLIERKGKIRVLLLLEGFDGWEETDWDDARINKYTFQHDADITKLALVGDRKWEEPMLAFAGHPLTAKDVRFFETRQLEEARAWLD